MLVDEDLTVITLYSSGHITEDDKQKIVHLISTEVTFVKETKAQLAGRGEEACWKRWWVLHDGFLQRFLMGLGGFLHVNLHIFVKSCTF